MRRRLPRRPPDPDPDFPTTHQEDSHECCPDPVDHGHCHHGHHHRARHRPASRPHRRRSARAAPVGHAAGGHLRGDPAGAVPPQGAVLPRPAAPGRCRAAGLRAAVGRVGRPPDGAVEGRHADPRARLEPRRARELVAHRRDLRGRLPAGLDPARGDAAAVRRRHRVGQHRSGLRGIDAGAEGAGRPAVGAARQRLRLRRHPRDARRA